MKKFAQKLTKGTKIRVGRRLVALANDGATPEGVQEELIGLENEFQLGSDGWVRIAPYGRHLKERIARGPDGRPRQEAFEQVLDRAAAEEMVRRFNSPWGKLKRFIRGAPIFKHHPDLSEHAPETITPLANDKRPYGMFAALEARDDGFYGKPIVTEEGQAAIENEGLKWLSPLWRVQVRAVQGRNVPEAIPLQFISAGLTKFPNIQGGEALANNKETMNKTKLLAALSKLGITLANEATDEQIETAIGGLVPGTKVTALENDKGTLTQQKKTAEELLGSEKTLRVNAESKVTELTTALANERTAKVKAVLDTAILQGRITAAERDAWQTKLVETFETNVTALANEKPKIKTEATTEHLGERKSEADKSRSASDQFLSLANECMEKQKCDFDTAWKRTKKAQPALYEEMSVKK